MKYSVGLVMAFVSGCKTNGDSVTETQSKAFAPVFAPGPQVMVYKAKADCYQLVPVLLSADKRQVVSYPHPRDLKANDKLKLPVQLMNGYLYDQRGIGENVAFLSLTYAEYAALEKPPTQAELLQKLKFNDPLTELCNCGNLTAFTNPEKELNELITSGRLHTVCRTIK